MAVDFKQIVQTSTASFPILLSKVIQLDLINLIVKSLLAPKTNLKLGSWNY